MTDSSGAVVWSADYKPFGDATVTVSTITNNLRFPGQYYDAETGNHYNYFRDYNPVIGNYIEADSIGLMGGINLYRYVENNPLKIIDPRGQYGEYGFGTLFFWGMLGYKGGATIREWVDWVPVLNLIEEQMRQVEQELKQLRSKTCTDGKTLERIAYLERYYE